MNKLNDLLNLSEDLKIAYEFKKQIQQLFIKGHDNSTENSVDNIIVGLSNIGILNVKN